MHTASKLINPARFPKSASFGAVLILSKIMGPNPLKLCEELLASHAIAPGATVLDLGSGTGITSALLCREYGFNTYAVDLWSDPEENRAFFDQLGLPAQLIHPVKADASQGLPFAEAFFDAVVSVDSFNFIPKYFFEQAGENGAGQRLSFFSFFGICLCHLVPSNLGWAVASRASSHWLATVAPLC